MIQENTTQRFHSLGVLLLLDAPPGIELGIDNISWKIGSKFKGIKMIPLGTHIITYSLASQNHMFKISKFLIFSNEQRILVYKWNQDIFEFCKVKGEDAEGYITGVKHYHFDAHLGPYPQSNLGFWAENTKYINKETIDKLDPIDKLYRFENQYNKKKQKKQHQNMDIDEDQNEQNIDQNIEIEVQKEAQPENTKENIGKFQELSDTIYYSYIPRFLKGQPELITKVNMDKTPILKRILSKEWKNKQQQFLAELQYSFIHFIIAENQQSLEQWKKIIDLIVFSESAFLTIRQLDNDLNLQKLIMDFIPVLYEQLNQFPVDFFRDELSKTSFMVGIMKQLKLYSKGQQYSLKIRKRIKKLLELVKAKFDYIVHSQDEEEDKPILVNQNESYF